MTKVILYAVIGCAFVALAGCSSRVELPAPSPANQTATVSPPKAAFVHRSEAFETQSKLVEHFHKHGAEFGNVTVDQYLRLAQDERDKPAAPPVEEIRRADGVTTRFDSSTGGFLAFNGDHTIRTFFRPNDGRAYFIRQANR